MKDKYFLVYNPVAGKIKSSSFLAAVKEFFQSEDSGTTPINVERLKKPIKIIVLP